MASEDVKKKWGTIFMGDREASVEQLNAMQEPLRREKQQKGQAEDYMERVRLRAADRAREILGAAYTERQKVLEEARAEAAALRKAARAECATLVAQGEAAKQQAQAELRQAETEREQAVRIREAAHQEGIESGLEEAAGQLHDFRTELGSSLGVLMQAIEGQRRNILETWRDDLCELTRCAVQTGVGLVLEQDQEKVLASLLHRALDVLENRSSITVRVNPENEASISDLFLAAREKFPELHTWIVTPDKSIAPGGLVAESGSGSADLRRENFQELINGVLEHLGLPESEGEEEEAAKVRALVEKEVAAIAAATPEPDREPAAALGEEVPVSPVIDQPREVDKPETEVVPPQESDDLLPDPGEAAAFEETELAEPDAAQAAWQEPVAADPSLAELEDELFPLEEPQEQRGSAHLAEEGQTPPAPPPDPHALAEGGFV